MNSVLVATFFMFKFGVPYSIAIFLSTDHFTGDCTKHVGVMVSTSDSGSGIAGSSPDEGTVQQGVTSLGKIFTRTCSAQPGLSSFWG